MTNLLDKVNEIRNNLATARRESDVVDELLALTAENSSPEALRQIAGRLRAVAEAKEGDWVTHTFTPSTAAELRCLAEVYEDIAKNWEDDDE
jgi:hypothetical protein